MFREEKMKGEREIENNKKNKYSHGVETPRLTATTNDYRQNMLRVASSCSSTSGFCFSDAGSSSSPTPFDHSQKHHFMDQLLVGSDSLYTRRGNINNGGGVMFDELGLAREFHKMNVVGHRNEVSSDVIGRLGRDPHDFGILDYNVPKIRLSKANNFGCSQGFINGFSGSGGEGFPSSIYADERNDIDEDNIMLGQRRVNVGADSMESFIALNQSSGPYSGIARPNCLINYPLEESSPERDEYYGNFTPVMWGNKYYDDGTAIRLSGDCLSNGVAVHRIHERNGNGGLIQRGDGGYGNDIPLQLQPMYGPQVVGGSLQNYVMEGCKGVYNSWAGSQNLSIYNPYAEGAVLQQCGGQFCGNIGGVNSIDSSQLIYSKQALNRGNVVYNSKRERMRAADLREVPQSALMKKVGPLKSYGCESALIMKEKDGLSSAIGKFGQSSGRAKNSLTSSTLQKFGERSLELKDQLQLERSCGGVSHLTGSDPVILYNSLAKVQGNIYLMAKDQHGCRFLQKKFDEGSFEDVELIFNEIIDHVVELMMNPFGNYLIQKLLDVCNEDQRMNIVLVVTKDRGELVRISLNTHGTRVVQKLIESLKTRKQISWIIRALEPGFLDLIKDLNGNHVVQRCLQCLSSDENKFIFDAAAKFCVEIATHRHGCCVLQRCIAYSNGEQRKKLVDEICRKGLHLAQDPFGNYVVQYIIEQKIPSASAQLITQFEGHFVHLSMQKFSSHVVEKCLKFVEDSQPMIVYEFLSVSHFEQLLQDPFANYVIQSALEVTKGTLNDSLVAAVRPFSSLLRTNPYCKKIFTRGLLKK